MIILAVLCESPSLQTKDVIYNVYDLPCFLLKWFSNMNFKTINYSKCSSGAIGNTNDVILSYSCFASKCFN